MKTYDIGPHPDSSSCEILNEDRLLLAICLDHSSAMIHLGVTFAVLAQTSSFHGAVPMYGLILKNSEKNTFQRLGAFYSRRRRDPNGKLGGFELATVTVE
jgi:hypothetical protein